MMTRVQLDLTPTLVNLGLAKPAAQEAADPAKLAKGPALSKAPLRIQGGWVRCGAARECWAPPLVHSRFNPPLQAWAVWAGRPRNKLSPAALLL